MMLKTILAITCTVITFIHFNVQADPGNRTFRETKQLARQIWADHRESFYCGCRFDKHLKVIQQSCDFHSFNTFRAKRIEWEHLVPVSWMAYGRDCWQKSSCFNSKGRQYGGRNCCEKTDAAFKKMYNDLHNLVPAIGEVNKLRAHYPFVDRLPNIYSKDIISLCHMVIDEKSHKVLPPKQSKGVIARAHLYMAKVYGVKLKGQQIIQYHRWSREYPPSDWEIEWNKRIARIDGSNNTYISNYK